MSYVLRCDGLVPGPQFRNQEEGWREGSFVKVVRLVSKTDTLKRYRKALRAIASDNYQKDARWARGIAKAALEGGS